MRHYLDANSKESPIPTSLRLHYDDESTLTNGSHGDRVVNGINGRVPNGHANAGGNSVYGNAYTIAP
jgi:hypothetical protein